MTFVDHTFVSVGKCVCVSAEFGKKNAATAEFCAAVWSWAWHHHPYFKFRLVLIKVSYPYVNKEGNLPHLPVWSWFCFFKCDQGCGIWWHLKERLTLSLNIINEHIRQLKQPRTCFSLLKIFDCVWLFLWHGVWLLYRTPFHPVIFKLFLHLNVIYWWCSSQ